MIKIENLNFAYEANNKVIKNLTLEIKKGSYTVIYGPNGSGKSTLVRLIAGLLPLRSGNITIDGITMNDKNLNLIHKKIGIVFQNPDNQFIGSTVEDDIAFGLENHNVPQTQMRGIIDEYAKLTGMGEFLEREPVNLSGGQKQRVAIAGVLAIKPQILIFDEATSMLDPMGKKDIMELIIHMRKLIPDLTIISISHELNEANYADQVIVLNKGEIFLNGDPKEIFTHTDLIYQANLQLPFINYFKKQMSGKNINLTSNNTDEMVVELCQLALNK